MAIIAECEYCLAEYDAKRSTSRFCSPKCKQAFYRNRMNKPVTLKDAKPVTVTQGMTEPRTGVNLEALGIEAVSNGRGGRKLIAPYSKRGKDIKCFEDLPPDVQGTINEMSIVDGLIDHTVKANRTAIAIHYQHIFPHRYYQGNAV